MAQLVRLEAQDADASSPAAESAMASVFVRCRRPPRDAASLQLLLAEGDALWTAKVAAAHKPAALACSGADFLRELETAFSGGASDVLSSRSFKYKWSRASGVLTLMEPPPAAMAMTAFAMKYASLTLTPARAESAALWDELLRDVVHESAAAQQQMARQRRRLAELEASLRAKDALLDTALRAKQQLEDQLFGGFCDVLNAKKDEIRRLQHELAVAQVQVRAVAAFDSGEQQATKKRKKTARKQQLQARKPAKAVGAKLRRTVKLDNGSDGDNREDSGSENGRADDVDDSDSPDQSTPDDSDDGGDNADGSGGYRRSSCRAQRSAVEAYSQLPSSIRSSSQVCAADDVLSDLDAIMKDEVAANDDEMQGASTFGGRSRRPQTVAVVSSRAAADKKRKSANDDEEGEKEGEEEKHANRGAKKPHTSPPAAIAAPAPVVKAASVEAIDSEEEDILDMLA